MESERLILAMAPIENVLVAFQREAPRDMSAFDNESYSIAEQDRFAALVHDCWTDLGPSSRYFKSLIRSYAASAERAGITLVSNGLMDLVFRASTIKEGIPRPDESCHLSFRLPPYDHKRPLMRIQVYPYHNDVALRLWEAGAGLAEYFVEHPDLVRGKSVIEIGAGVGLTGLTIAGCCGAREVHLTDYTDACRVNLAHNISINRDWLEASKENPMITQGYLEWSSFVTLLGEDAGHEGQAQSSTNLFDEIDVLVAADVVYDVANLKHLVAVLRCFLQKTSGAKRAIFAITKRNMRTFDTFIELLNMEGIRCDWTRTGEEDHPLPPLLFPCNFIQKRTEVRIAHLSMS